MYKYLGNGVRWTHGWTTNKKSHVLNRIVRSPVTLNDLERYTVYFECR